MDNEIAITVDHVTKDFKLPHEKNNSIKSVVVNFYKRNKSFEVQQALRDVSFDVKKGEFFGIVGRNGSGKSTMLKMLAGIYSPTKGGIQVKGKLTPFIELGVGFNMELTGRENVFLNGALLGFSRKEMNAMYKSIVEFAELKRFMDQKLKNYSSGMQVRLAFSIAIRAESDILLLDEVLAVGDAAFQQKCYDYFEELKRKRKTVVLVTHDMSAIRRFCNRAIYIKDGDLIYDGDVNVVADTYAEDNIRQETKQEGKKNQISSSASIETSVIDKSANQVVLEFSYKAPAKEEIYVGISVLKDGFSIAEISTMGLHSIKGSGKTTYTLDTSVFNAGAYQIGTGLYKLSNRELIATGKSRNDFVVRGSKPYIGGAVKLHDTWKVE